MSTLSEKINMVLDEEKRAYAANGRRIGGLGSFNIGIEAEWTREGAIPVLIVDQASQDVINSENAKLLLRLYSSLPTLEREEFKNTLLAYLSKDFPYYDAAHLIFYALHKIGLTVEAITQARQQLKDNIGFSNILVMLKNLVKYEHSFLGEELLEQIKSALEGESEHSFQLLERINSAQLKKLAVQLEGNNQEINEDKETLKSEFRRYKFPEDLSETLDKIDQKLRNANDSFDYKGCMDLIRSFTERFYESLAKDLNAEEGKKMDEKDSEKTAKFFKEQNLISEDQSKILISLRHFLSNAGSHRLKSRPEDARLSRNMTIEFCLYLLRRYEDIKKES